LDTLKGAAAPGDEAAKRVSPPGEIFGIFLKLGCTSFGGPVAHIGYFRDEFVKRRGWFSESAFADIVALCQFMPGPASSQTGMAIGLIRGGYAGMFAAWIAFTLPSALLMIAFALGLDAMGGAADAGWIRGLKLVAVAVVAQAVLGMAGHLCPDRPRASLAILATIVLLVVQHPAAQILVIVMGGIVGLLIFESGKKSDAGDLGVIVPRWLAIASIGLFLLLLGGLPILLVIVPSSPLAFVETFYRAGALVFGGGHVVLPLLESGTVGRGWIDRETFLAGYGAAQALPGPLFTFAGYLGTLNAPGPNGIVGGMVGVIAIFASSFLLVLGLLPFWSGLRQSATAQRALMGVNAAVVGLLGAALYDPVFTAAVLGPRDAAVALAAFLLLHHARLPPWFVVILGALAGVGLGLAGQAAA